MVKENVHEFLLAVLVQNGFHDKNSKRREAVENNSYKQINSWQDARCYLAEIISKITINRLRQAEATIVQRNQQQRSRDVVK